MISLRYIRHGNISAYMGADPIFQYGEYVLSNGLFLPSERDLMYFVCDTSELLKGDILKHYQAYKTGLECNVLQIDEARYKEDLPPLGLNWIKLVLQDVLYDPKPKIIYTPNMNQSMQMSENTVNFDNDDVDKAGQDGIMEERENNYKQNPDTGKMEGSYPGSGSVKNESSTPKNVKRTMSFRERKIISSDIATNHPNLKEGETYADQIKNDCYVFTCFGFGKYSFLFKFPIVGNEDYMEYLSNNDEEINII